MMRVTCNLSVRSMSLGPVLLLSLFILSCGTGNTEQQAQPLFAQMEPADSATIRGTEIIEPNDNIVQAGLLQGNTLTVNLVAEAGMWHPAGVDKPGVLVQAFREEAGPLQIPAPTPTIGLLRLNMGGPIGIRAHGLLRPGVCSA